MMYMCRKGIPCVYATVNGYCQLTACIRNIREVYEEGYRDDLKQLADKTEKAEQIYSFVSYNI